MWCGPKSVTVVPAAVVTVVALMMLALPAQAPGPAPPVAAGPHPASCKALPPLGVDAVPVAGTDGHWSLALRSLDDDRDVQVWMQTSAADRRVVWRGHLSAGEERRVEVNYTVPAGKERVFVALEPIDMGSAIVRGLDVVSVPTTRRGRAQVAEVPDGRLLENPDTGARIRQFTGTVGGQR